MQNREEKPRWTRPLIFIAILMVLVQTISYIPKLESDNKNGNFWPFFYKEIPKNSLDIVFMGNSHSKTTFIPEVIDKLLGTNSIHVNTSGESIYQTVYEFREVMRYQDPQMIVLEANPIYAGLSPSELKPWNFSFFYSMPWSIRKVVYSYQFFNANDLMSFYLPYARTHANWKDFSKVATQIKDAMQHLKDLYHAEWHVELPHQGYENYLISLPLDAEQEVNDDRCSIADLDARLAATETIFQKAEKESQKMIVIEAPQFANSFTACRDQVVSLSSQYNISYQTPMADETHPSLWFGDNEHMTQFGAIIASVKTAEVLAEKLDIAINREMLAQYKRYFFRDYTLVREGDTVTLTLIPDDAEAIQEMIFQWNVYRDDELIYTNEEAGRNDVQFTLPEQDGDYFIHIVMHDPSIHYYLRGGFNYAAG